MNQDNQQASKPAKPVKRKGFPRYTEVRTFSALLMLWNQWKTDGAEHERFGQWLWNRENLIAGDESFTKSLFYIACPHEVRNLATAKLKEQGVSSCDQ